MTIEFLGWFAVGLLVFIGLFYVFGFASEKVGAMRDMTKDPALAAFADEDDESGEDDPEG